MFIERIDVANLRCFRKTSVNFLHPERPTSGSSALANITLLLGDNGAGKSSLLRAVALSALSPVIQNSGYVPFSMVRKSTGRKPPAAQIKATFRLHAQDGDGSKPPTASPVKTEVQILQRGTSELVKTLRGKEKYWNRMYDDSSQAFLVVGYGATRRMEASDSIDLATRQKSRLLRYQRVAGLFEEHLTMVPLSAWLPQMEKQNPGRHKQVVNLLNRLLPEDTVFKGELNGSQYVFEHRGTKVPFGAMSDGYRQYAGWIGDLLYHVCMGAPSGKKLVENRGIVLIDEIDLHLHPEWQRTVIPTLAQTLPNLQFILTSHSPILVGTLYRENVMVFDHDRTGSSIAVPVETEVHGLNADQVLTSRAFGLSSSRAPEFVNEMKAVSARAQAGDREAERRFHRMIVYGAAGNSSQSPPLQQPPADIVEAARRLGLEKPNETKPATVATPTRGTARRKKPAKKKRKK